MKKYTMLIVGLIVLLAIIIIICTYSKGYTAYEFPKYASEITVEIFIGGVINTYSIKDEKEITSIKNWYNTLDLEKVNYEVEQVFGNQTFAFDVDGQAAFVYRDDGRKAYIIVNEIFFQVKNPSTPPI